MIKRFHELQEKILSYYPEANIDLLKKAYTVSTDAHLNQKRASNEPYIIHPLTVAGDPGRHEAGRNLHRRRPAARRDRGFAVHAART